MHKLRDAPGDAEEDLRRQIEDLAGDGRVYVLGLGNTDRADDGAGILVALALKKRFPSFSYSEHDGVEGTVLDISEKEEDATVLFVDASNMGLEPGSIKFIPKDEIKETEITTHRVAVALMASILEKSGKKAAVIGIQPETIEFRGRVSKPVRASVQKVVDALLRLMMRIDR
jgi:hydrogenase 3 maturation protease